MVDKVLAENPKQLEQYRGGKTKLQGYFAGQVKKDKIVGLNKKLLFLFSPLVMLLIFFLCTLAR